MAAPLGNTFAEGNNGGNPGYGKIAFIRDKVIKFSEKWWTAWESMINGEDKELKKFAMTEFNKLQAKLIPTTLSNDDTGNFKMSITWKNEQSQSITPPDDISNNSTEPQNDGMLLLPTEEAEKPLLA